MRTRLLIPSLLVLGCIRALGQDPIETFMTKFEEAVKADNYAGMKELVVKAGPDNAADGYMRYEYQLCSAIANKSDEDKVLRLNVVEKMTSLISQEFKNRMPADRLAWVKTLTPEQAGKRVQMGAVLTEAATLLGRAEKGGEKPLFQQAAAKYAQATATAAEIKDLYWEVSNYVGSGSSPRSSRKSSTPPTTTSARSRPRASRRRWTWSRSSRSRASSRPCRAEGSVTI